MEKAMRILALLLAIAAVFALCACGAEPISTDKGGSSGTSKPGQAKSAKEQCDEDEKFLKDNGYYIYVYSSYLDSYESKLGAESGSLARVVNAYNDNGDGMLIYYFKTEAQAKVVYNKDTANYKLSGIRVVYGDPEGLIK